MRWKRKPLQPLYWMLFQEFRILKQTVSKKPDNNSYFLILDMLLLFKRVTAWQTLKSQGLNQTVHPLKQLCEVGIRTATGTSTVLSSRAAFSAENCSSWNHCSSGQLEQLFPPSPSPQSCPSYHLLLGLDHLFFESYNIVVYESPNCCFDLYALTLNHGSITMMFKNLIHWLTLLALNTLGSLLHLLSLINKDDIINRSKILRSQHIPFST